MTAEQIGERYVVGAGRLRSYSARGGLPCRRRADGTMLYSEEFASAIFRPRGVATLRAVDERGSMGTVGESALGGGMVTPGFGRVRWPAQSIQESA